MELGFKVICLDFCIRDWDRMLFYEFLNDYVYLWGLIGGFLIVKCFLWIFYCVKSIGSEGVNILELWIINIGVRNKNDRFWCVYDEFNNYGLFFYVYEVELKRGVVDKVL